MPLIPNISEKKCGHCGMVLSSDSFHKNSKSASGLKSWCKQCTKESSQKYYLENKASINARNMEWARSHPMEISSINKKWRINNPELVAKLKADYRSDPYNKEAELQKKREWRKANKDKSRLYSSIRRAKKASSSSSLVTSKDLRKIKAMSCIYCNAPFEQLEHIVPLARGGRHAVGNLAPSCAGCNQSKGSKFVMEWKLSKVRYN